MLRTTLRHPLRILGFTAGLLATMPAQTAAPGAPGWNPFLAPGAFRGLPAAVRMAPPAGPAGRAPLPWHHRGAPLWIPPRPVWMARAVPAPRAAAPVPGRVVAAGPGRPLRPWGNVPQAGPWPPARRQAAGWQAPRRPWPAGRWAAPPGVQPPAPLYAPGPFGPTAAPSLAFRPRPAPPSRPGRGLPAPAFRATPARGPRIAAAPAWTPGTMAPVPRWRPWTPLAAVPRPAPPPRLPHGVPGTRITPAPGHGTRVPGWAALAPAPGAAPVASARPRAWRQPPPDMRRRVPAARAPWPPAAPSWAYSGRYGRAHPGMAGRVLPGTRPGVAPGVYPWRRGFGPGLASRPRRPADLARAPLPPSREPWPQRPRASQAPGSAGPGAMAWHWPARGQEGRYWRMVNPGA